IDVGLAQVLQQIGARGVTDAPHARAADAVARERAAFARAALGADPAAAVDVRLAPVLHDVEAARRLADVARANPAHAVRGGQARPAVGAFRAGYAAA